MMNVREGQQVAVSENELFDQGLVLAQSGRCANVGAGAHWLRLLQGTCTHKCTKSSAQVCTKCYF